MRSLAQIIVAAGQRYRPRKTPPSLDAPHSSTSYIFPIQTEPLRNGCNVTGLDLTVPVHMLGPWVGGFLLLEWAVSGIIGSLTKALERIIVSY